MEELKRSDKDVERALWRVMNDEQVCEENRKLISEFVDRCFADGLTCSRICKLVYAIHRIARYLGKPFPEATKLDIQNVIAQVERSGRYAEWTKHDFKSIMKKLYKWLKGNGEFFPDEVRWIKSSVRNGKRVLPENILTEDEVKLMAEAATHPRDKAFVLTLYESGCRIGEMLSLKIKSVQFDEFGAVLRVSGKTGDRRVRVVCSAPLLATWIDLHPLRADPEAALWTGWQKPHSREGFRYHTMVCTLRELARRAGINRRVYPHLFRHSRATALANKLTEAQMKEHFGWVQASEMASVYVHLSGRDVDEALLKTYGIKTGEAAKEETFRPKTCPRCKATNSPISKFCQKCGFVLDAETVIEIEANRKNADELLNELMKNDEIKAFLVKKIAELGLSKQL
ncbi:MAG: site-specific integrase [Candidatus Micrarchaeota archaeon]|nr:site-specific integrase [Candidatus Micrarchaeota archaeon]